MSFPGGARVVVVGAGLVGSTAAYAVLQRGLAAELVLCDVDGARAEGEAMDLSHAVPFLKRAVVRAAPLASLDGADLVIVAAGRSSKPGETRLALLQDNAGRMRAICAELSKWRALPVVLVVSNPVDVLAELAARELKAPPGRVLGSGTTLDTARLKVLLGERFGFDPHSIEGFVLGEHGDSEVAAWSTVRAGGLPFEKWPGYDAALRDGVFEQVRVAAYEIVKRKRATYYAVASSCAMICEAILRDQRSVYPVSVSLTGQYGLHGVSLSLPCVLGAGGVRRVLEPGLAPEERSALERSAAVLRQAIGSLA